MTLLDDINDEDWDNDDEDEDDDAFVSVLHVFELLSTASCPWVLSDEA